MMLLYFIRQTLRTLAGIYKKSSQPGYQCLYQKLVINLKYVYSGKWTFIFWVIPIDYEIQSNAI